MSSHKSHSQSLSLSVTLSNPIMGLWGYLPMQNLNTCAVACKTLHCKKKPIPQPILQFPESSPPTVALSSGHLLAEWRQTCMHSGHVVIGANDLWLSFLEKSHYIIYTHQATKIAGPFLSIKPSILRQTGISHLYYQNNTTK